MLDQPTRKNRPTRTQPAAARAPGSLPGSSPSRSSALTQGPSLGPSPEGADRPASLSALDKALSVLEAVVAQPRPIGLPDLTADLGLPRQTIHRILGQLCDNGLLLRDPARDRYAVGPRLSLLAMNTLRADSSRAPLRAVLTEIVADTEETCNFGVLDGLAFVYLERLECSWSLRVHLTAGSRVPAHCTSGGKVLLACLDRDLRSRLVRSQDLVAHTANTITDPDRLSLQLDAIAANGYALNDQEYTLGVIGVAVPVRSPDGRALAALALHGPSQRFTLDDARRHVPRLHAAAARLTANWA